MKRKITSESKGVTEIVGTMLLLVIAIILFTTVYFSVLSISPNPPTPSAYIVGNINDKNEIIMEHFGGSSLPGDMKLLLSLDGSDVPLTIDSVIEDTNHNDKWDMGEYLVIDSYDLLNKQVAVTLVDQISNSIVMTSIIQERPSELLDPFVTTGKATQITSDSANIKLEYNFRGLSGSVYFKYKKDGGSWKISTENESNSRGSFEQDITGLESNVTYVYQAVLKYNTSQYTYGEFKSFKTKESILETEITDISFSFLSPNTITLNASSTGGINPDNITLYYRWSNNEKFINTASWWNSNWKHRKMISLTNPIKAYQLRLEIGNTSGGDFSCDGNIGKDDFSDLRFISYKDNQTVYPMWQESIVQDTQTLIWCNLTDNSSKLWVYYGNSLAENTWNGEKTFDFFDDFNENDLNSSKWYQYGGKKLQVSNGILSITANNNDPSKIIAITAPTGNMSVLRARFKADKGNNKDDERIGLGIKTGLTNGKGYNYVLHDFENLDEISFLDDKVEWSERYESWTKSHWYIFEIYHDGYQVYGRHDDNIWLNEPWSGRIGYPALNIGSENAESYWDWALVRKKSHSPPIISEITSEETYSGSTELSIDWKSWNNQFNPKTIPPWNFNFDFPNGFGYYEFYSIGQNTTANSESPPSIADAAFFISFDDFSNNESNNFTGGPSIGSISFGLDYYQEIQDEGIFSYCLGLRNNSGAYWKLNNPLPANSNRYYQIFLQYDWSTEDFSNDGYWTFEYYKESTNTWEIVSKYQAQINFSEDVDAGRFTEWLNESDGYEFSDSFNIRFVCYTDNDEYNIGNYQLLLDNIYIIAVRK